MATDKGLEDIHESTSNLQEDATARNVGVVENLTCEPRSNRDQLQ